MTKPQTPADAQATLDNVQKWWTTSITDIAPGSIRLQGYAIEDLMGRVGFADMIWLMLRGELPLPGQHDLFEAALVAGVDHGPHAPSIAIARMAVTCGASLNGAVASAVNVLDDVHGGAGEQAMALFLDITARTASGASLEEATTDGLDAWRTAHGRHIPGFGHRFHPIDPRSPRLLALADTAAANGIITGEFLAIAREVEASLGRTGKRIPMNVDAATAAVYAELGFAAPLARGLFVISRGVGVVAHAWEQMQQGGRIKGPMPPSVDYVYAGVEGRSVPPDKTVSTFQQE